MKFSTYILWAICTKQLGHLACHIPHPAQPLVPRLRFSSNKGHNGPGPRSNSRSLQWYLKMVAQNAFLSNWWLFFTDSPDNVSDYVSFNFWSSTRRPKDFDDRGARSASGCNFSSTTMGCHPETWRFIMNQKPMKAVSKAILWLLVLSKPFAKNHP